MEIEYTDDWFDYNDDKIDVWFDPETFDWGHGSFFLAMYCSKYFNKWFDADKYDWSCSFLLAGNCSKYFHKWFDPDKFYWDLDLDYLIEYCLEYIDFWYDLDRCKKSYDEILLDSIK